MILDGIVYSVETISFCSNASFFQAYEHAAETGQQQSKFQELQYLSQVGTLDDLYLNIVSPPFQVFGEKRGIFSCVNSQNSPLIEPNEEKPYTLPSASMEILRHCRGRISTVNGKKIHGLSFGREEQSVSPSQLSTNQIIELSAANFIKSERGTGNELYASHPYASAFLGLSKENAEDVQLMQDLLYCAEKVSNQQYDSATKLLEVCHKLSFSQMNKTQRLVYYFTEALREKIDRESGRCTGKGSVIDCSLDHIVRSSATATFFEKVPFSQITQFTGIQEVVEYVSDYKKVHVIDLAIRCGIHHLILMQALAERSECPIKNFKVTAIAIEPSLVIEETGNRLRSLASSLNVDFSFHVIMLENIINHQLSLFVLDDEERVLVHGSHALERMASKPDHLETLMRVIRRIDPCVMIITEVETNVNSPVFVNRFVEALFFFGAYFDSLEDCLKNDVAERAFAESKILSPVIRDTVGGEEAERKHRIVGINVWRAYFARFGMVEMELSKLALKHADLVLDRFDCRDSCTLGLNGNSLIVSWKGTPISSLSVWKF